MIITIRRLKKTVIRKKIRQLNPDKKRFYVVYLPIFSDENLMKVLKQVPLEWKVFSKYTKTILKKDNIEVFPIDEVQFLRNFQNCESIL